MICTQTLYSFLSWYSINLNSCFRGIEWTLSSSYRRASSTNDPSVKYKKTLIIFSCHVSNVSTGSHFLQNKIKTRPIPTRYRFIANSGHIPALEIHAWFTLDRPMALFNIFTQSLGRFDYRRGADASFKIV